MQLARRAQDPPLCLARPPVFTILPRPSLAASAYPCLQFNHHSSSCHYTTSYTPLHPFAALPSLRPLHNPLPPPPNPPPLLVESDESAARTTPVGAPTHRPFPPCPRPLLTLLPAAAASPPFLARTHERASSLPTATMTLPRSTGSLLITTSPDEGGLRYDISRTCAQTPSHTLLPGASFQPLLITPLSLTLPSLFPPTPPGPQHERMCVAGCAHRLADSPRGAPSAGTRGDVTRQLLHFRVSEMLLGEYMFNFDLRVHKPNHILDVCTCVHDWTRGACHPSFAETARRHMLPRQPKHAPKCRKRYNQLAAFRCRCPYAHTPHSHVRLFDIRVRWRPSKWAKPALNGCIGSAAVLLERISRRTIGLGVVFPRHVPHRLVAASGAARLPILPLPAPSTTRGQVGRLPPGAGPAGSRI